MVRGGAGAVSWKDETMFTSRTVFTQLPSSVNCVNKERIAAHVGLNSTIKFFKNNLLEI
jgi:hypothetical protein